MPQRLGQHFLSDKSFLKKIVDALNIEKGDFIIEIGPGHGELTRLIAENSQITNQSTKQDYVLGRAHKDMCSGYKFQITAIEKDPALVSHIMKHVSSDNLEIIQGDALKILPQIVSRYMLHDTGYKLVGNIPYYITGYLFRIIADLEPKPKTIVFTIQKEVAERICACPTLKHPQGCSGSEPKMNLLAASIQFWAKPEIIGYIPKTAFFPQPKVDSAIIKLIPKFSKSYQLTHSTSSGLVLSKAEGLKAKTYYSFVKILFKQPRKTILNNLSAGLGRPKKELEEILKKVSINPNDRPQNLSIEKIVKITKRLL